MTAEGLRLIYATQSIGLRLFWRLHQTLAAQACMGPCGFFVTNRYEYTVFERREPDFEHSGLDTLREWDMLEEAWRLPYPDLSRIAEWERAIGDPTLWNALIIDRRMGYGLRAQFAQSYKPAYNHETLLKILQVAIEKIVGQFDRVKPQAVIGLNAVTLYDYLYYLVARQRGLPYFQLKLTRVRNYASLYTEPFELSSHIREVFNRLQCSGELEDMDRASLREAREVLEEVRSETLVYEGAIKRRVRKNRPGKVQAQKTMLGRLSAWMERLKLLTTVRDTHYPSLLTSVCFARLVRPLRRSWIRASFDVTDGKAFAQDFSGRYAVYPLNTEPEVALLAYGRPYRNQVETVRNIACALPVGWKLLVKEHPNAYGYRTRSYYRKLKQIPNVLLASPSADTSHLLDGCALVALVYGTIGLEALIKGKPVITLCETPYGVFPRSMVRYVDRLWQLGAEIQDLLEHHAHDDDVVAAFLAAHIRTGVRVNLFTGLLSKGGRETGNMDRSLADQYADLANYVRNRVIEEDRRLTEQGLLT